MPVAPHASVKEGLMGRRYVENTRVIDITLALEQLHHTPAAAKGSA